MTQRYGYLSNGTFRTFSSIDGCRKSVRMESFKNTDEYQIVRFNGTHIKTGYQSNDVLVGMAYQDYNNPKMVTVARKIKSQDLRQKTLPTLF